MNSLKLTLIAAILMLASCAPGNKLDYLQEFDAFITEVSENCSEYTEEDWAKATEKYEKFTGEWYEKYEHELTVKDEIKVASYVAKWMYCEGIVKGVKDVGKAVEEFNVQEFKEDVQYYIENDMMDELEDLLEEAKKKGREAQKAVEDVLEEMESKIEELSK